MKGDFICPEFHRTLLIIEKISAETALAEALKRPSRFLSPSYLLASLS